MMMRKTLVALTAMAMVLAAGCGSKGGVPTQGAVPTPAPAAPSGSANNTGSNSSGSDGSSAAGGSNTSGGTSATPPAGGNNSSPAPAQPQVADLGTLTPDKEAVMGPLTLKLGQMEGRPAGAAFPNYDFFLVQVTLTNTGNTQLTVNSLNIFTLQQPDGKTQKLNIQAQSVHKEKVDGLLDPGKSVTGWLGYLTKITDGKYKLLVTVPDLGKVTYEFEAPPM